MKNLLRIAVFIIIFHLNATCVNTDESVDIIKNSMKIYKDGENTLMSSDNISYNGVTYVPIRTAAEDFGYNVSWSEDSPEDVIVTTKGYRKDMVIDATIQQLMANPEKYNGCKVDVSGKLYVFWEYGCAFTSGEYQSIKVSFGYKNFEEMSQYYKYDGKYVNIIGTFRCEILKNWPAVDLRIEDITYISLCDSEIESDEEFQKRLDKEAAERYGEGTFYDQRTASYINLKYADFYREKYGENWRYIFSVDEHERLLEKWKESEKQE